MRSILIGTILLATATASARPRHSRVAESDATEDSRRDQDVDKEEDDNTGVEATFQKKTSLDDLIEVAVRLAPDLMRTKIDRVAAANAAEGSRRDQAWIATASTEAKRSALAEDVEAPPFSEVANNEVYGGVGLGRNLPTGGNIQLEAGFDRKVTEYNIVSRLHQAKEQQQAPAGTDANDNPYDMLQRNTAILKATYKQPLSRGFGSVAVAPQKKADLQASEATVKAQLQGEELVRDLVSDYWDLALASYELDVRNQALDLAKKQDKITHDQIRAGSVQTTAGNAVDYEIQIRQEAALRAQITLEQKSLDVRRKAGLELGKRQVVIVPAEKFDIGDDDFDIDEMIERSHAANRKLATVQLEKKIAEVDVDMAEDQTKPQLDLTFSGAVMGDGNDAGESIGSVGNSYTVSVGLNLSFELSGAAKKSRDAALAKKRRLDVDREDIVRQIDTEVVGAVRQVQAARTRVTLADKAIQYAEDNLRAEGLSFNAGRTNNFQIMQRQTDLIEAKLRRGQAVADYHKAVAQLQFLSGDILGQYRVNVRPRGDRK
ncbi:MAG TPA: TolC family protein [Kofleriaceae bacterium]|nr:TolC family protein [Kofleriaceae bacterium]